MARRLGDEVNPKLCPKCKRGWLKLYVVERDNPPMQWRCPEINCGFKKATYTARNER